jgi:hypothetical protein
MIFIQNKTLFRQNLVPRSSSPSQSAYSRKAGIHLLIAALSISGFSCSKTTTSNEPNDPFAKSSSNQVIGKISWVDYEKKQAVVQLATAHLNPEDNELLTRSKDTTTSSLLKPTNIKNKKSLGVKIVYGNPVIGDEVILKSKAPLNKKGISPADSLVTTQSADSKPEPTKVAETQEIPETKKIAEPKKIVEPAKELTQKPPAVKFSNKEVSVKIIEKSL